TSTNVKRAPTSTGTTTVTLTIPDFVQDKKKLTLVAVVLAGVVPVLGFLVANKKGDPPLPAPVASTAPESATAATPAHVPEAPKAAPASGTSAGGRPETARPDAPKAEAGKPDAARPAGSAVPAKTEQAKGDATRSDAAKGDAAKGTSGSAPTAPAVPPATLVFSIQPWGEVYVNGKQSGVSPPVKSIKLAPGKYKVEIRNTTFAEHVENIEVKSRDELTIRHRFQ
ncbi:MAG TPA: PEGA domain-containing protein, partial [Usitatibacteraceae bacterium]|nr:PEGA domain-containing protein [Usitatibacteraceae bacterium]